MPKILLDQQKVVHEFTHLNDTAQNTALYHELCACSQIVDISSAVRHPVASGYALVRVDGRALSFVSDSDKFEIALLNHIDQSVVYYNRVLVYPDKELNCKPATQILVWRSRVYKHKSVLDDLATNVFFNYILENYSVIVSDNNQTVDGMTFWQGRISEALFYKKYVYHYNVMTGALVSIISDEHLASSETNIWGEHDDYREQLAIISNSPLPKDYALDVVKPESQKPA